MLWFFAFIGFIVLLPSLLVLAALGLVVIAVPVAVLLSVGIAAAFFFFLLLWPGVGLFHLLIAVALGIIIAELFLPRRSLRA
jgi:hypothetical protein